MTATDTYETVLSLDVGERRIGIARAHLDALFAAPLLTLDRPETFLEDILALVGSQKAAAVVIGLPRGLSGQDTAQTRLVQEFGRQLDDRLNIPLYWIDEALTSRKAEAELQVRGRPYTKGDIDMLAATYILEDFITNHKKQLLEQIHG